MELIEHLYPVSVFLLCVLWTIASVSIFIFIQKMVDEYDDAIAFWEENKFAVILHIISIVIPIMHTCLHLFLYYKAS